MDFFRRIAIALSSLKTRRSRTIAAGLRVVVTCLLMLGVATLLNTPEASAATYFNSIEPGCDGSDPTVLFCDDFEDGDWVRTQDDINNPINDGWATDIYYPPGTFPDPQGTGFGRCGGKGAVGTNCTATSGPRSTDPSFTDGQAPAEASHNFAPANSKYNEIYFRYYVQPQANHQYSYNDKLITINPFAGSGGIYFAGFGALPFSRGSDSGGAEYAGAPTYEQIIYIDPNRYQNHNCAGGTFTRNPANFYPGAVNPICINPFLVKPQNPPHWYYVEIHVKRNTPGLADGIMEVWMDDCSANGLGCIGPGTLRLRYTDCQYVGPGDPTLIGAVWIENYENPNLPGEEYYDQIVAATRRIGPMGKISTTPPVPPTKLRIVQ